MEELTASQTGFCQFVISSWNKVWLAAREISTIILVMRIAWDFVIDHCLKFVSSYQSIINCYMLLIFCVFYRNYLSKKLHWAWWKYFTLYYFLWICVNVSVLTMSVYICMCVINERPLRAILDISSNQGFTGWKYCLLFMNKLRMDTNNLHCESQGNTKAWISKTN